MKLGPNEPADPATLGYSVNHFGLVVKDLDATIDFYTKVIGMRHIFTYSASDKFSIAYIGHSHGGKNGTGYQTTEEMLREKNNSGGLMEFLHLKGGNSAPLSSETRTTTFSHVGLIVPDIKATQDRMDKFGIKVLKRIGEIPTPGGPLDNAFALGDDMTNDQAVIAAALRGIAGIGFEDFLVVADPDGNLIEIQQQN
ncbi:hypothetical protein FQN54_002690 [Arachnomyces sp. PD_36]|nr:hypothetical protein FQN54_002690 [Arachnomyces sp. PD_36]